MSIIAKILIALVALEHVYFLVLEMFLWTAPRTRAAFGMSAEQAEQTRVLAGNQGLYNGFLSAGLIWSLIAPEPPAPAPAAAFSVLCGVRAGRRALWRRDRQQAHLAVAGAAGGDRTRGDHPAVGVSSV